MLQDLFAEPTTRIIEIVGDRPGKVLPPQPSPTYQRVMQEAERRKNDPHFPIRNLRNITVNSTESSADTSSPATTQNSTTSTAPTTTQASSSTSKPTTKSIFPQSTTTSSWERRVAELHDRYSAFYFLQTQIKRFFLKPMINCATTTVHIHFHEDLCARGNPCDVRVVILVHNVTSKNE
jgi:hypothetical protein